MVQAFQGYFQEDGRFIPDGMTVTVPKNTRAYVLVVPEEPVPEKTLSQRQYEAFQELWAGMDAIDDEPFDEEFDEIMSRGVHINRELDL